MYCVFRLCQIFITIPYHTIPLTDPIFMKIDKHVRYALMPVENNQLLKTTIVSCKFMQFLQKSQL